MLSTVLGSQDVTGWDKCMAAPVGINSSGDDPKRKVRSV